MKTKQMRISDAHHKMLGRLSTNLGVTRAEILGSVITLAQMLIDNKVTVVKVVCADGEEREILLPLLIGNIDES